jgi:hypothetical protein
MKQIAVCLLAVALSIAGCSDRSSSEQDLSVSSLSSALSLPAGTPVPMNGSTVTWQGTVPELLLADAWASCSFGGPADDPPSPPSVCNIFTPQGALDSHLAVIADHITTTTCPLTTPDPTAPGTTFETYIAHELEQCPGANNWMRNWYLQRSFAGCNGVPNSTEKKATVLGKTRIPGMGPAFWNGSPMDAIIRAPGVSQCIAQKLRSVMPGSAGPAALSLTSEDQRMLLEETRLRSVAAVVGYAQLATVFSAPAPATMDGFGFDLYYARAWATGDEPTNSASEGELKQLGGQMLTAVQLAVVSTKEMVDLLGRSASGHAPRGGPASANVAAEDWGPGNWRARALQALYGGDPLSIYVDPNEFGWDNPPWKGYPTEAAARERLRHPTIDISEPEVGQLLQLARRYDALELKQGAPVPAGEVLASEFTLGEAPYVNGGECMPVDGEASAARMYRQIEAGLRNAACATYSSPPQPTGCGTAQLPCTDQGTCAVVDATQISNPNDGYQDFLLWKTHRIRPSHAKTLVSLLDQQIGKVCSENAGGAPTFEVPSLSMVRGQGSLVTRTGSDAGTYYHLNTDAQFVPVSQVEQVEGRALELGTQPAIVPAPLLSGATDLYDQGFLGGLGNSFAGTVPALVALREALYIGNRNNPNDRIKLDFFKYRQEILDTIAASAGTTSITVETPVVEKHPDFPGHVRAVGDPDIVITAAPTDSFWDPADQADIKLLVLENEKVIGQPRWAPRLAAGARMVLDPTATTFTGQSAADVLGSPIATSGAPEISADEIPGSSGSLKRWVFHSMKTNTSPEPLNFLACTLAARKGTGPSAEYRLLLRDFVAPNGASIYGVDASGVIGLQAGFGGALNDAAARLVDVLPENPSKPRYDAFGLPMHFAPPTDAAMFGGNSGTPAFAQYLENARTAATSAVSAVNLAFQTLLEEEREGRSLAQQVAKSKEVIASQRKQLCGEDKSSASALQKYVRSQDSCDPSGQVVPILSDGNRQELADVRQACSSGNQIACMTRTIMAPYDKNIELAGAVAKLRNAAVQPAYAQYSGGKLQQLFSEQWAAYRQFQNQIHQVFTAYGAADANVAAAQTALNVATEKQEQGCSTAAMNDALIACVSVGVSAGATGVSASVSFNMGPLIAAKKECTNLTSDLQVAAAEPVARFAESVDRMAEEVMRAADGYNRLILAVSNGERARFETQIAVEQAVADAALAQEFSYTNGDLFRQYHVFEVWRAKALVENARRLAVIARRAIEARYAVDLSTMNGSEPFVASPALWADDVYAYDLNLPAAVGVTNGPSATQPGIYPNGILDYVENLDRFVKGFVVQRPSASAQGDSEVISLPGLSALVISSAGGTPIVDSRAQVWSFYCPDGGGSWVKVPANGQIVDATGRSIVCGSGTPATEARVGFSLDPWARVDSWIADPPYARRYNARFGKLAVNLVGTGVLDCSKATDPQGCYAQSFVRYDLTHVGPSWVTDYDGVWHALGLPNGQIEGGKALAAEQWLEPLSNAWGKPYVSAVGRTEFSERPFGGVYDLRLKLGPEIRLDRIERVQLLLESNYWVKQN